ncbi:TetR/AcrR family transcriptional regulator [bacterium]|nr:TetR/AcrR family transcriptional regulator [bacterium]
MRTLQEHKRRQILDAAAMVFAAKGFHKALMDDVAARAGIGKGTIYRYFSDKEELFFSVLDSGMDDLKAQLTVAAAGKKAPDRKLAAMVKTLVDFTLRNRPLIRLLPEIEHDRIRKRADVIHGHTKDLVALMERGITAGIKSGAFRDGDAHTWARMLTMLTRTVLGPPGTRPPSRDRAVGTVLDVFFHGIAKR